MKRILFCLLLTFSTSIFTQTTDWSRQATLSGQERCETFDGKKVCFRDGNRENILNLSQGPWESSIKNGANHAMYYPVEVSELQIPYDAMKKFFEDETNSPMRKFFYKIAKRLTKFTSFEDTFKWLGLHQFPTDTETTGPNYIPQNLYKKTYPMGVRIFDHTNGARGMTIGCAACHSTDLFGVKVLGMTNRFPKGNDFIHLGRKVMKNTPRFIFKGFFKASDEEMKLFDQSKEAVRYIGVKKPIQLGLDTSLAQVGLSLAMRSQDEYASRERKYSRRPRKNALSTEPADSKPAVWWNLKYKTRWLSDGSIVSGNPIHTNFLWNEIGRGIDLKKLETWFTTNQETIDQLTSYVFATKAPKFNDFFPRFINIPRAQRGEKLFIQSCAECHGVYEKGWSHNKSSYEEQIETVKVWYHKRTPVKDVGTDSYRRLGMQYFAKDLNRLKISQTIGTKVVPQKGYVPPPLVGIWARYPYFHNNSVPSLMQVLTPDSKRVKKYIAVAAEDRFKDFDVDNVGYPAPEFIRESFQKNPNYLFDTGRKGMSNKGHTEMLLDNKGGEKFSLLEKKDIIEFLKSL